MEYANETLQICKAYNIEPNQVIFAFAIASGAPITDAYLITHKCKPNTTQEEAQAQAQALLTSRPALKIIINRIKNRKNPATFSKQQQEELERINQAQNMTEEERDEFLTRHGLIGKIIDNITLVHGKDAISGLQTLAKLQGYDKPDEQNQEEKRQYFLPWVSHCRSCQLMKVFRQIQTEKAPE